MQCRQRLAPMGSKQWKVEVVGVKVDDVESLDAARQSMEPNEMIGQRILAFAIEAQGALTGRPQNRLGARVAAGEQCDIVPPSNQFFRQIGHHSLGAAIELRRAALIERRNL